jgi:hypothetical protein
MSKAIQGVAELGGAILIGAGMLFPPTAAFMNNPIFYKLLAGLAMLGIAMEAGAIADALTSNRGTNITTRQPAAFRQIVYGTQRLGGIKIYQSTTGSHHDQVNYVIVLAGHECWAIQALYLDGRKVYFNEGSSGHSVRNGWGFGGSAAGGDHIGPGGQTYNFGGLVYAEARYGDQLPGDVILGLTANDPKWAADGQGNSPYVGGCTYIYLKRQYSPEQFPQEPEIRITVMGRPVMDPRAGSKAYSANWALIANDIITDPVFGLGDDTVNQDQLIAAANVCDEQVALAAGGTEARYECHMHYDTSVDPGSQLDAMMPGAAGRLSRIGGEWYIWPAYWQGPSFSFDQSALTGGVQWSGNRGLGDLCNRVQGTYTAPNYPYNVAGNLYDSNGWYEGTIEDRFPFGFQPTSFPQYEQDERHGYPSNEFLNEDSRVSGVWDGAATYAEDVVVTYVGTIWRSAQDANTGNVPALGSGAWTPYSNALPKEISLQTVLSIAQAQRVAKIVLMRNRKQGSGALELGLQASRMQPLDVMNFTLPYLGWTDKVLEVVKCSPFRIVGGSGDGDAPTLRASFGVQETGPDVYEWSTTEELTVYDVPAGLDSASYTPAAPTNMAVTSSAATALQQPDGTLQPRARISWDTPLDGLVSQIQTQFQHLADAAWTEGPLVDVALNYAFLGGVVAGEVYNFRIRSRRPGGASSDWEVITGYTVGLVLSTLTQDGYGRGSLVSEAYADGTAAIIGMPFTAEIGNQARPITPTPSTDLGLAQGQLYYMYWIDPTFAGGNVDAIATQDPSDFRGKPGYFLIDSIVTKTYAATGGGSSGGGGGGSAGTGQRFYPSNFHDLGSRSTFQPEAAYDGDSNSRAVIAGSSRTGTLVNGQIGYTDQTASGDCVFDGFPAQTSTTAATLTVRTWVILTEGFAGVTVNYGNVSDQIVSLSAPAPLADYTTIIPAGTDFSTISVDVSAVPSVPTTGNTTNTVKNQVADVFIET